MLALQPAALPQPHLRIAGATAAVLPRIATRLHDLQARRDARAALGETITLRRVRRSPHALRRACPLAVLACCAAIGTLGCGGAGATPGNALRREVWGFTAFWDSASASSVARNGASLDAIVTTWIALDTAGGLPQTLHLDSARAGRVPAHRLALVTSYLHPSFRPTSVRRLAANPRMLARVAGSIAATMTAGQQRGAVLDFEAHTTGDLPALTAVVRVIADTLHARQLGPVVVAIPATDTVAYPGRPLLDAGADLLLPMLYDQHWAGGNPGPIAEPRWVSSALALRVAEVGAERLVAALPLYGYSWAKAGQGTTVAFAQAKAATGGQPLVRDSATRSLRGPVPGGGQVWVTDAQLLDDLLSVVEEHGVQRVALWYVGQEDPVVWERLFPPADSVAPSR